MVVAHSDALIRIFVTVASDRMVSEAPTLPRPLDQGKKQNHGMVWMIPGAVASFSLECLDRVDLERGGKKISNIL
jgi:hypothetical protein